MATDLNPMKFSNPFLFWTDMSMRAAEAAVASTQNISDAADRSMRAVASAEVAEITPLSAAAKNGVGAAASSGSGELEGLNRTMVEMMTQSWMRWMSSFGSFIDLGARLGSTKKLTARENPLETIRTNLRPADWGEKPATKEQLGSLGYENQRGRRAGPKSSERAMASAEPKPRRAAAKKPRRAARASRK